VSGLHRQAPHDQNLKAFGTKITKGHEGTSAVLAVM
jgi:hypothetical protein